MHFVLHWGTSRMNWAWATSLDQLWRSPTFPMWVTLAAAGFFGIILLITLVRAEKSVANGALTVITLLAIAIAAAATLRGFVPGGQSASGETRSSQTISAALPALSCIDDLAGDTVLTACEKGLFGSAESAAAALSYAASQITWLTAFGDVAAANASMTPELQMVRRAVERDRYGLMAYVLAARDHCTPSDCAALRAVVEHACGGASAGRGSSAVDATRQTHQRRLPQRSLNPAHKHHDAGAGAGDDAHDTAPGGGVISTIFISTANQRTIALA